MNVKRAISQRWRKLSITTKFSAAFGLLLMLIALVVMSSYVALTNVRRQTEAAILTSTEIQRLVLEMDRGLEKARRLQRDFFLRYPELGFADARDVYAQQTVLQISKVMKLSTRLKQLIAESDVSAALRESDVNLNLYLSASERYADTFVESVELVTQLAADETGLQAQLVHSAELLRHALQESTDVDLMNFYREMQSFKKDYLITRQHHHMQSAFNVATRLRWAIDATATLETDQKTQALTYLDTYRSVAAEIVQLDTAIRSKLDDFDLQAESVDPISAELIALADEEVERGQAQIAQASQLAMAMLGITALVGLGLAGVVANVLNNSITRNIIKLTKVAGELQAGNLGVSAHIDSADELGDLARTFNSMTTQLRQTIEYLKASEEHYRGLFEGVPVGLYRTTPEGQITDANSAFVQMTGHPDQESLLAIDATDLYVNPGDRKQWQALMERKDLARDFEVQMRRHDGMVIWVQNSGQAVRDSTGSVLYYEGSLKDITERKRAEEELGKYRDHLEELVTERTRELEQKAAELEDANVRLQEADRLKSVFLASMSHELRTPLNSIIGFTGVILQGLPGEINEEQRKQLGMIKNSSYHLLSLISEILDIAKIEAGRVEPSLEEFELDAVVREVVESFAPGVSKKGLELDENVPEGITLFSDRRRVKQILMNFVGNAVKFTEEGNIRVTVKIADAKVEMSVTDTGTGIKEEDMNKLFQPFQQVEVSLTKKQEGTGLGLYLSKKLARLLGGDVWAKSEFGKGSEFSFIIPLKLEEEQGNEKSAHS